MKFIALISGGKDSIFNILKCIEKGHELVAVANLYPKGNTNNLLKIKKKEKPQKKKKKMNSKNKFYNKK
jgi:diphthamide synthase (EF-2-diphthine--ammonia ligase)